MDDWYVNSWVVADWEEHTDVANGSWDVETAIDSCDEKDGKTVTCGISTKGFIGSEVKPCCWGLNWELITWNAGIEEFWKLVSSGEYCGMDDEELNWGICWSVDVKAGTWDFVVFNNCEDVFGLISFKGALVFSVSIAGLVSETGSSGLIIGDWGVRTGGLIIWGTWDADA